MRRRHRAGRWGNEGSDRVRDAVPAPIADQAVAMARVVRFLRRSPAFLERNDDGRHLLRAARTPACLVAIVPSATASRYRVFTHLTIVALVCLRERLTPGPVVALDRETAHRAEGDDLSDVKEMMRGDVH